jgi:hypothetical protein
MTYDFVGDVIGEVLEESEGQSCFAHDEHASIETVSRDGKGMFGAQAASETAHPSM